MATEEVSIPSDMIERPLPDKPTSKSSMMARFGYGKRSFLSGKGKDKSIKKKQDDNQNVAKVNDVTTPQQLDGPQVIDTTSTKTNMPKSTSVPFFQRLFSRSKSQTEDELNSQLQRNSVVMSDTKNFDMAPNVPSHLDAIELVNETENQNTASGKDGNEFETIKSNDTTICNENAIFELLDSNNKGNEIQT